MDVLNNESAMAILRDAADRLTTIGIHWEMQTGRTEHGVSVALIASDAEEGASAGYVASFLGHESAELDSARFAQEVVDHLANRADDAISRIGKEQ